MKLGIIGGSDGLGKSLIRLFRDDFDVYITGTNHEKGRKVAEDFNVDYIKSNTELASMVDILIIAVPIEYTSDVIREVAGFMKSGSLMVDVTSIKEEPSQVMAEVLPDSVEFIPTHPIFGPRLTRLDNQVVVFTPLKKGEWYDKFYDYFIRKNMRVIETTPENHDYMMSIVQVLTHFSFISTAYALKKLDVDFNETEKYESPIYNLMIDIIARIVSQNPYLTYNIQSRNINGPHIRNTFKDAVNELVEVINNSDEDKFVDIAIDATEHMGDITDALGRSDKAIGALSYEYSVLYDSIGKEIGLKQIYSNEIHVGILESLDNKTAVLKIGNKLEKFRLANVRILLPVELYKWKIENSAGKTESVNCIFPKTANADIIKETVLKMDNIIDVNLTDVYDGSQIDDGSLRLTFDVKALSKDDIGNVKNMFEGFGGIIQ